MADLIDRQALTEDMYHRAFETDDDTMWQSGCWVRYRAIEEVIKKQPSIDAVEVVRCKDCKHNSLKRMSGNTYCDLGIGMSQLYDFCSLGERKDDG